MKIGLYFGSFNPIHIGHLIVASYVANHTEMEQVWFVVSPQNPLKPSSVLLNEYHRLHLVHLAVEEDLRLKASEVEFKLPRPSYTIDTLTYLQEKYPQYQFSIIMGSSPRSSRARLSRSPCVSGDPVRLIICSECSVNSSIFRGYVLNSNRLHTGADFAQSPNIHD